MSQADSHHTPTPSRFHNISNEMLADAIGEADANLKAYETEVAALKSEAKRRGILEAAGDKYAIGISEVISGRLDTKAIKEFLGDGWRRFEVPVISTVLRIKPVIRLAAAA